MKNMLLPLVVFTYYTLWDTNAYNTLTNNNEISMDWNSSKEEQEDTLRKLKENISQIIESTKE